MDLRVIAFYLPQYHPIPENDACWGTGFTEWTKVTKARPLFRGHYQPHLPPDLGFYDFRVAETREAQADLARQYGVTGFCYFHYWFAGKRLLNRPFDEVLKSGKARLSVLSILGKRELDTDLGRWAEVLIEQKYSEEDYRAHIRWLANAFADSRYIRVENKPLFIIYRAHKLPDIRKTIVTWRDECRRLGIGEIFLCRVDAGADVSPPKEVGLDAAVEFQPDWLSLGAPLGLRRLRQFRWNDLYFFLRRNLLGSDITVQNYRHLVGSMSKRIEPDYLRFPCVTPPWDNSPRRRQGPIMFIESSPELFQQWVVATLTKLPKSKATPRIFFVNAWNEWAEGNHLEPDQRYGRSYLKALKRALREVDGG
jgi:lipopolysaccharide biosynthesis protein